MEMQFGAARYPGTKEDSSLVIGPSSPPTGSGVCLMSTVIATSGCSSETRKLYTPYVCHALMELAGTPYIGLAKNCVAGMLVVHAKVRPLMATLGNASRRLDVSCSTVPC
jgi:hypothetical protein